MLDWLRFTLVWSLLCAGSTFAQTLDETVRTTLRTNPDVLASQYGVDAAEELKRQAKGAYLPSVDVIFAGGYENSNNTTTRALGQDDFDLTRAERSIRLTQLIYDGSSTVNL
ncbi:MAG: adhesin transport system outer membrane protein, partial [Candidatus Azotimanducaceae bacterium]